MTIQSKVSDFLTEYSLWDKALLVGFSGGFDSSCLLDVLHKISKTIKPLKIIAIHYNHNWRGEKAKQEQVNCRKFCQERDIEFYTETAPNNVKHSETEARELRYAFFERGVNIYRGKYRENIVVLTAHNYDDNAETVLYRIAKGTGIVGLKGILPNRDKFYRPLINISRNEIEKYCKLNKIYPNYDDSNDDTIHKRNLIRHEILPLLEQINPDIKKSLNTLSKIAISESEIIDEYISKISEDLYDNNTIKTPIYKTLSKPVQQKIIYNLIYNSEFDYTMETIINICNFIELTLSENKPSKFSLNKNNWIYADKNIIEIIKEPQKTDETIEIKTIGEYSLAGNIFKIDKAKDYKKTNTERKIYADLSDFDKLYIRTRRDGDIIQPLGSSGHTKLKKYLMSKNIPQHRRDELLLLTDGKEILWVCGVGMSEKIKVKTNPTHFLSIN